MPKYQNCQCSIKCSKGLKKKVELVPPFFTLLLLSFQPCVCIQDDERSEDEDEDHVDEVDLGHNVSCKDESGTGDVSQFWLLEANHD